MALIFGGIGISDILSIVSVIIAPIIGSLITLMVWLHRRIQRLERQQRRQNDSLYGREADVLSVGVIKNVQELTDRVDELEDSVEDQSDE